MKRIIDKAKATIPPSTKRKIKRVWLPNFVARYSVMIGQERLMPDFIIIGAQRSGTTYLYDELKKHPCVAPALEKEIHFFDLNYRKGLAWYGAHFPPSNGKQICERDFVTGEASPYYLFHPHAPKRVSAILPHIKLIALLRNPVDRAYSHYHHEVRLGFETLSFQDAIAQEQARVLGETRKMLENEDYHSFNHRHYSYLSRGVYVDQLKLWLNRLPKEQVLILKSEDFYHDPPAIMKQVTDFLKLPSWNPEEHKKRQSYPKMDATIRKYLIDYFEPHNQRLYEYLGVNLGWDR